MSRQEVKEGIISYEKESDDFYEDYSREEEDRELALAIQESIKSNLPKESVSSEEVEEEEVYEEEEDLLSNGTSHSTRKTIKQDLPTQKKTMNDRILGLKKSLSNLFKRGKKSTTVSEEELEKENIDPRLKTTSSLCWKKPSESTQPESKSRYPSIVEEYTFYS
eukprot:TRINITY_DN2622_c0_g4_i1.p1 TRINITY_DN2622_c0_g4~~TRINITY_DN2622_c0_g4_i1.p1  ORF type:complete len:164 (-),score=33.05 TRINITY_DN2622_c0_g4_i1:134-625(-)